MGTKNNRSAEVTTLSAPPNLPRELLRSLQAETPFTAREIQRLWARFKSLEADSAGTVDAVELRRIEELLYNPFATRIAEVFSEDGSGRLSFKNFLELFSVFSPRASFDVKLVFLFAIWDFDGDDLLGQDDISKGLKLLLSEPHMFPPSSETAASVALDVSDSTELPTGSLIKEVVEKITREADLDPDYGLTFQDFQSMMQHAVDFQSNFRMTV